MPLSENFLLSLKPSVRAILSTDFQRPTRELASASAVDLSKETRLSVEEAGDAIARAKEFLGYTERDPSQLASTSLSSQGILSQSALEIMTERKAMNSIITFCQGIDQMLGDGVKLGEVTEFCGIPGIGKTQLAMQLCANVQIPRFFGGVEGEALYIDTEGSFTPERMHDISTALHKHLVRMVKGKGRKQEQIDAINAIDLVRQLAVINELPQFLRDNPKIKLVIFDSIAFHFRHDLDDTQKRNRLIASAAQDLQAIARKCRVAVVAINQVTTRLDHDEASIVPALGESWAHACTTRVFLYYKDGGRIAHLFKSPSQREATCPYRVVAEGVRGVPKGEKRPREE